MSENQHPSPEPDDRNLHLVTPSGQDEAPRGSSVTPRGHVLEDGQRQRRRARPWWLILLAVLLAVLLGWFLVSRFSTPAPAPVTPTPVVSDSGASATAPPAGTQASADAELAQQYESRRLAGDTTVCQLNIKPDTCKAGFDDPPAHNKLSEPVSVIETAPVMVRQGTLTGQSGTGVRVGFTIAGQQHREVALLIIGGKMVNRVTIGNAQAGLPLAVILSGGSS